MPTTPPAILLGSDCLTGLQVARILWRSGVEVIAVARDRDSPYCRTRATVATFSSTVLENPSSFLSQVRADSGTNPVVLACTDEYAQWLNAHREAVVDHAHLLLPPRDTLDLMSNKARFYRWVVEQGLELPDTRFIRSSEDLERAAQEMAFPIVVKPPHRTRDWLDTSHGSKVCYVESPETLSRIAPPLLAVVDELILQAWIPGPNSLSRELSICLDGKSDPIASVVFQKIRQWPAKTGTGSLVVQVEDEEVMRTGLEILRRLGHAGVCQVEFKRSEADGLLYLVEMNPGRAALNFPLCEASGVELTNTWYCATAGLALPVDREVTRPGAKWICWKRDIPAAFFSWRQGTLGFLEWLASIRGRRWSADVRLDDPIPLIADIFRQLRRLGSTRFRGTI